MLENNESTQNEPRVVQVSGNPVDDAASQNGATPTSENPKNAPTDVPRPSAVEAYMQQVNGQLGKLELQLLFATLAMLLVAASLFRTERRLGHVLTVLATEGG